MVLSNQDKEAKIVILNCNCGCDEAIQVKKWEFENDNNDEQDYYLSIHTCKFSNQRGIFKTIGHRIKLAFMMLMGKEYRLCEIVLNKQELDEFKEELKKL